MDLTWLIQVIVILIVVGVLLWLVNTFIPMDVKIKQIVNAFVVICVVLALLLMLLNWAGLGGRPLLR